MPSPLAHVAAGLALTALARSAIGRQKPERLASLPAIGVVAVGYSLLPDIDSAAGLLSGEFGRYHNHMTHSLAAGFSFSAILAVWVGRRHHARPGIWFGIACLAYFLHLAMDAAQIGRGIMAFWPFTSARYQLPITLFYGLHWSDGWFSLRHLWTVLSEGLFALFILLPIRLWSIWKKGGD